MLRQSIFKYILQLCTFHRRLNQSFINSNIFLYFDYHEYLQNISEKSLENNGKSKTI